MTYQGREGSEDQGPACRQDKVSCASPPAQELQERAGGGAPPHPRSLLGFSIVIGNPSTSTPPLGSLNPLQGQGLRNACALALLHPSRSPSGSWGGLSPWQSHRSQALLCSGRVSSKSCLFLTLPDSHHLVWIRFGANRNLFKVAFHSTFGGHPAGMWLMCPLEWS